MSLKKLNTVLATAVILFTLYLGLSLRPAPRDDLPRLAELAL